MAWMLPTALITAAALPAGADGTSLRTEVIATERAFAQTMADRDLEAFARFLADDAIFLMSDGTLRGKAEVVAGWKRFYEGEAAPFSWEPETVEVLASGDLAFSTGPVRAADGTALGIFNSVWRRAPDGGWRIVFDRGCPAPRP